MTDSVRIHSTSSQAKNEPCVPQNTAQASPAAQDSSPTKSSSASQPSPTTQPSPAARIGAVIARERRAAGITQDALANHLGVTKAAVSKWELGQSAPDIALIPRIAGYFGISCDELLGYAEEVDKNERDRILDELLDLLKADFDAGFEACKRTERAHWRDWPLLALMASILMNRALYAPDNMEETLAYLEQLLMRLEDECPDLSRCRAARMMRASLMLLPQEKPRVDESIALFESLERDNTSGVPSLLAAAYDQAGRTDDALALRQRIVYVSGANVANECLNQLSHYQNDPAHLTALAHAASSVIATLRLDAVTPLFALSSHVQLAAAYKNAGMREEALDELSAFQHVFESAKDNPYATPHVHDAVLFDRITEDFSAAEAAQKLNDMNASILLNSMITQILSRANWDDCVDDSRYQAFLALRSDDYDIAAHWTETDA